MPSSPTPAWRACGCPCRSSRFPSRNVWTHLALAWDETHGIRFYVNGKLAAENKTIAVLNTALDQFGPHSRIISPYQVQSDYNFIRGGDIDEVRIHDRMLNDGNIATLAQGDAPADLAAAPGTLARRRRHPHRVVDCATAGIVPTIHRPRCPRARPSAIRKVEITDAYDIKRWWWRATDGIRETTWPGVYNRSSLPGRNDYFQLPDWDCYSVSGKAITFVMPDEPWNHLEISGAAWGKMELLPAGTNPEMAYAATPEKLLFERPKGQEKTIDTLATSITGRKIRFTNVAQEEPIGELVAYNVTAGSEPAGSQKHSIASTAAADTASVAAMTKFIAGRFSPTNAPRSSPSRWTPPAPPLRPP